MRTKSTTIMAVLLPLLASALSMNHSPRIGDAMQRTELSNVAISDSGKGIDVNLTKCRFESDVTVSYISPARKDTACSLMQVVNNNTVRLLQDSVGNIWMLSEAKPDMWVNYVSPYPEWTSSMLTAVYSASGRQGSLVPLKKSGTIECVELGNATIISPDADTLVCEQVVEAITHGLVDIQIGDSSLLRMHKGVKRQYYLPGYRYPVLEMQLNAVFDDMGVTDSDTIWTFFSPSEQVRQLPQDPENESLRKSKHNNKPLVIDFSNKHRGSTGNVFSGEPIISWNGDTQVVNIVHNGSNSMQITLADILGRVLWHRYIPKGSDSNVNSDMNDYPGATYFLVVNDGDCSKTFKFAKQ